MTVLRMDFQNVTGLLNYWSRQDLALFSMLSHERPYMLVSLSKHMYCMTGWKETWNANIRVCFQFSSFVYLGSHGWMGRAFL